MSETSPWQVFTGKSKFQLDCVILQADLMGKHRQLWAQKSPRAAESCEIITEKDWLTLPNTGDEKYYLPQSTESNAFTSNWVQTFFCTKRGVQILRLAIGLRKKTSKPPWKWQIVATVAHKGIILHTKSGIFCQSWHKRQGPEQGRKSMTTSNTLCSLYYSKAPFFK